jgi:hypothetical protein
MDRGLLVIAMRRLELGAYATTHAGPGLHESDLIEGVARALCLVSLMREVSVDGEGADVYARARHDSPIVWARLCGRPRHAREVHHYHLTRPCLDFCVAVTVHDRDGQFMATADLAEDTRDLGVGKDAAERGQGRAAASGRAVRERAGQDRRPS